MKLSLKFIILIDVKKPTKKAEQGNTETFMFGLHYHVLTS